jgi:dTDP-4-amino-4,6-dideoxygalactose transaminase
MANGIAALQVAGRALGSESILSTPFSFVATACAFLWQKDKLGFADINSESYNLCPEAVKSAIEQDGTIDTVVATHVCGNPCDVEAFVLLGNQQNKKDIYDASHAFGIHVGGQSVHNYGDASTLSFHATKVFHTVEGGGIVFKQKSDYEKAKYMINFGFNRGQGIAVTGINGKLNEYQAAVGLVNLEQMDNVLEHGAALFDAYHQGLKDLVEMPSWHPQANHNGAYMPIKLESKA